MTHLPQSNSYSLTNITNNMFINFDNNVTDMTIQLTKIVTGLKELAQEAELSFITEELELTKLQKDLLQLKYDLLQDTNENLITKNKAMSDQLEAYTCSICLTNSKDCILEPCGHFVCCIPCISMLPNAQCPVCRTKCNYYIKVFNS